MAEHKFTFKKKDRLRHHKQITLLFKEGTSFHAWPINLVWLDISNEATAQSQVMFSVPKRNFKHANQRNLLRRRMKEVYRKLKPELYQHLEKCSRHGVFAFVYIGNEVLTYNKIQDKIILLLRRLKEVHEKTTQ